MVCLAVFTVTSWRDDKSLHNPFLAMTSCGDTISIGFHNFMPEWGIFNLVKWLASEPDKRTFLMVLPLQSSVMYKVAWQLSKLFYLIEIRFKSGCGMWPMGKKEKIGNMIT